ncbi:hypothetical protein YPPY66_4016, partial [Yersinia pestis PY-66]
MPLPEELVTIVLISPTVVRILVLSNTMPPVPVELEVISTPFALTFTPDSHVLVMP